MTAENLQFVHRFGGHRPPLQHREAGEEMATELPAERTGENPGAPREIHVPAPTAWPLVLAFGFTLLFAGLLTSLSVTVLGAVLSVAGCVGWFREVFPYQREEPVPVVPEEFRVTTTRRMVERVPVAAEQVRAWLPVHTYPVSAGVQGGLAGGVAMAVLAGGYGLRKTGSLGCLCVFGAADVHAVADPLTHVNRYLC